MYLLSLSLMHGWLPFILMALHPKGHPCPLQMGVDWGRKSSLPRPGPREKGSRYSLGRRGGKTCPLWPSFRTPCGKHEGESLQHKKGIDGSGGELLGYRAKETQVPGSAGRSATDRPQPCPSGDLRPPLTCPTWVPQTIFCFFFSSHLTFLAVYQGCQGELVPCPDLGSPSRGKSILLGEQQEGPSAAQQPSEASFS